MNIILRREACQESCLTWKKEGRTVALVPTMGFFHEGHLSLMRWARENADKVVVSLFVNPTQFGENEDLDAYPRDAERDARLAESVGVDAMFTPTPDEMYASDHGTWVTVPKLAENLCGRSRPDHFRGVATVVTKLFMVAMPDIAVFGEKDWQQLAIIKQMTRDLNLPVRVVGRPIVREEDGLAMSSRNVNLTDEERIHAVNLQKGLQQAKELAKRGVQAVQLVRNAVMAMYEDTISSGSLDYLEFVDATSMQPVETITEGTLAAVAWKFSRARLIDNLLLA